MPAYFAYGANLDRSGMAQRCPGSRVPVPARLDDNRFFIMADGYASLRREPGAAVYGLLWHLEMTDVATLDTYEEVDTGLYRRLTIPVTTDSGPIDALVYVGCNSDIGEARSGYMELVLAAAESCGLPVDYLCELRRWLPAADTP